MRVVLRQEMERDLLDLPGGAAVEGREGDAVVGLVRHLDEVRDPGAQIGRERRARGLDDERARAAEAVQPGADSVALDAFERVPDRDLELRRARGGREREEIRRDVDERPPGGVLDERLFERELLRPLDVEADVLRVDARARDLEPVQDLDRLQLQDPCAAEPGEDDVLRELRVGAGRGAEAGRGEGAVVRDGEIEAGRGAAPDLARLEVVDRAGARVLGEHAAEEGFEAVGDERCHSFQ